MKTKDVLLLGIGVGLGYLALKKYQQNKPKSENNNLNYIVNPEKVFNETPIIPQNNVETILQKPLKVNNVTQNKFATNGGYDEVIIPKGTIINDMRITGFGGSFSVNKLNGFDDGGATAKFDEFDVIQVVDTSHREKIDKVKFPNSQDPIFQNNGFNIMIGDTVQAKLNKDVKRSYPNKPILF